jgi:hypothetical protein
VSGSPKRLLYFLGFLNLLSLCVGSQKLLYRHTKPTSRARGFFAVRDRGW